MNTLRAKIALLLVVAIVSVVGILTWVMIALLGPPPPQRTTEPLAEQVEMFLRSHPEFTAEPPPEATALQLPLTQGFLRTLPGPEGMDGFFAARLRRLT